MLQLKSAYRDGTTHIVMSVLEFMQRLAALIPRPRLYPTRFHGVREIAAGTGAVTCHLAPVPPEWVSRVLLFNVWDRIERNELRTYSFGA